MAEFSFLGSDPETEGLRKMIADLQVANKQQAVQQAVQKQFAQPGTALFALEAGDGGVTGGFLDDMAADSNSQDSRITALENAGDSGFGTLMDIAKMGVQIYSGGIPIPGGK